MISTLTNYLGKVIKRKSVERRGNMKNLSSHLIRSEEIILTLRSLYESYGYNRCNVGTFEQYDFYHKNKSALCGEDVLVFTDADGRLMALKPDVTMSIVKNVKDAPGLRKVCYNENIYRIPTGGAGFRESVQTGLECIGNIDDYSTGEVLMLAVKSLKRIGDSGFILNLSHIDILDGLLDCAKIDKADRDPILKAVEQKNIPALKDLAKALNVEKTYLDSLITLTTLYGTLQDSISTVKELSKGDKMMNAVSELEKIKDLMDAYGLGDRVYLDFSIRGGDDYYSGLIFRGFLEGVSAPVLSGGRYDKLIRRMGKSGGGIGFAVYLDMLSRKKHKDDDEQTLLLYDDDVSPDQVIRRVSILKQDGIRVRAEREIPPECKYTRLLKMTKDGVSEID